MSKRPDSIDRGERAPGFRRAVDHRVALIPSGRRVVVKHAGEILADSKDVVFVEEGGYPPRAYVHRNDVVMARLEPVEDKSTFCPFKGLTEYYRLAGTDDADGVAWSYTQPYLEGELLRDRIAFDSPELEIEASAPR